MDGLEAIDVDPLELQMWAMQVESEERLSSLKRRKRSGCYTEGHVEVHGGQVEAHDGAW